MSTPHSVSGVELWQALPEVYRTRDNGDLAAYVDAIGELLDTLRATLDQRLADGFATSPATARQPQAWLLPYIADLLDVRLLSPYEEGRREEVGQAVFWRQRKGTIRSLERIAEAVARLEVEVQESWRRVATTPRIGLPLLPAAAYGEDEPDRRNPLEAARHPGLAPVTPDVRRPSRAVQADPGHPQARTSRFAGRPLTWRQLHPQGVPCVPGGFQDVSRRTADVRTPAWNAGHFHPRRILLFVPPPMGFFPLDAVSLLWSQRNAHPDHVADPGGDPRRIWNPSRRPGSRVPPAAVVFTSSPPPLTAAHVEIEDLSFLGPLTVTQGRVTLRRVAARKLVVQTADAAAPVVEAVDCLFDEIVAEQGLVRLDSCTVRTRLACRRLEASDCILAGSVEIAPAAQDAKSCVRYSRIPKGLAGIGDAPLTTTDPPVFFEFELCRDGVKHDSTKFGEPGCGVLHPASPASIVAGAEDGGEMGAYHHQRHCLARAAALEKLEDFLPVGMEAVIIPDPRLLVPPPTTA